jgi:uroporphyrinogen decarboxylase
VADYLCAQVDAGAQALQIFDTWGGNLSAAAYKEFSLKYMQRIVSRLPREADGRPVPVIVFTKGGGQWLPAIADCGADAVGLDWTTDIATARQIVGDRVALQGNMDPMILFASPRASAKRSRRFSPASATAGPRVQSRPRHHAGRES